MAAAEQEIALANKQSEALNERIVAAATPYSLDDWFRLGSASVTPYPQNAGTALSLDGTRRTGCPTQKVNFAGNNPATLEIQKAGTCTLVLVAREPTRVILQGLAQ